MLPSYTGFDRYHPISTGRKGVMTGKRCETVAMTIRSCAQKYRSRSQFSDITVRQSLKTFSRYTVTSPASHSDTRSRPPLVPWIQRSPFRIRAAAGCAPPPLQGEMVRHISSRHRTRTGIPESTQPENVPSEHRPEKRPVGNYKRKGRWNQTKIGRRNRMKKGTCSQIREVE
jgi:hypothetical protein